MLGRKDVQWNHNTVFHNLNKENTKVSLQSEDQMAIMLEIKSNDEVFSGDDIRDILTINFKHSSEYIDSNNENHFNLTVLNFNRCSEYDFQGYESYPVWSNQNVYRY